MTMERALVTPPSLIDDPSWERATLGPFVTRARRALRRQLSSGRPRIDLRATLERAYRTVPFYQERFRAAGIGLRDLDAPNILTFLPPTRRADLAAGIAPFLSMPVEPFALDRGWLGRTSGSTGEPLSYLRDPRTLAWFWAFVDFALGYAGRARARRMTTRRSPCVVLLDALEHMPEYDAALPLFHRARYAKRSSARPDLAQELARLDPTVITGDPESLAVLATLDPAPRPALVLSSAFPLPSASRDAIAAATDAAVLEYYATQETSVIGVGCRLGHGFHALSTACVFEISATGELLVTPTHNPSFVLLRYAPGDLGTVVDDACACGLSGPRIATLHGRTHVRFLGERGEFAAGLLGPLLARLPVVEHQLAQIGLGRFVLRVRGTVRDLALTRDGAAIELRLRELAGAASLSVVEVAAIPRRGPKPEPFVQELA